MRPLPQAALFPEDPSRPAVSRAPHVAFRKGLSAKGMKVLAGSAAALLLAGYVPTPTKVLQRWAGSALRPASTGMTALPVRLGGATGELVVATPGRHALLLAGWSPRRDPGLGTDDSLAGLWRALDLFVLPPDELASLLETTGVDTDRAGYARSGQSGDGVALTLGARGEGEPDLPQVWFSRTPLWPVRVAPLGREGVAIGPPGPEGWPSWFLIGGGRLLEVVGSPRVLDHLPGWVYDRPARTPENVPEGWRGAFEERSP